MPVEIKELIIRVVAQDSQSPGTPSSATSGGDRLSQEEIIEACVKQVLKVLQQSKSR